MALPGGDLILDGELVAFDEINRPAYHMLRRRRPTTVTGLLTSRPAMDAAPATARAADGPQHEALHLDEIWDDGEAQQGLESRKWRSSPYVSGDTDA